MDHKQRLRIWSREQLAAVAVASGVREGVVLDLLLRALDFESVVAICRDRRARDGAARAAWSRGRR